MIDLTPDERSILLAIQRSTRVYGAPPSRSELASLLPRGHPLKSRMDLDIVLESLRARGIIESDAGVTRGIRVLQPIPFDEALPGAPKRVVIEINKTPVLGVFRAF